MLGRLLFGIVKGLLIGGLLGFGLVQLGFAAPAAWMAYPVAVLTGVLIGLVAGKPIWQKDARIEAGAKAVVGALLGAGLMFAARQWLTMALPFSLGMLTPAGVPLGGLAIITLPLIAALLGGFYDADNDSPPEAEGEQGQAEAGKKRVAIPGGSESKAADADLDEDLGAEEDKKRIRK